MAKYSITQIENSDSIIDNHLKLICNLIFEFIDKKNIKAIVLSGGFGKGEGGITKYNGEIRIINDYDIVVVIKSNYLKVKNAVPKLNIKIAELSKTIEVKQIDLDFVHDILLKFAKKNVVNYELLNSSIIIWGDINFQKAMPNIDSSIISLREGFVYLFNRAAGALIALVTLKKNLVGNDEFLFDSNFLIELNKLKLSIGDSYLIYKKQYHYSNYERLSRVKKLSFDDCPNGEELKKWYITGLKWKLTPVVNSMIIEEEISNLNKLLTLYVDYLMWFETIRLNMKFNHINDLIKYHDENHPKYSTRGFVKFLLFNKDRFRPWKYREINQESMFPVLISLITSYLNNQKYTNKSDFKFGLNWLKQHCDISEDASWLETSMCFLEIYHPTGIINNIK